jgi:hypothetical protein
METLSLRFIVHHPSYGFDYSFMFGLFDWTLSYKQLASMDETSNVDNLKEMCKFKDNMIAEC